MYTLYAYLALLRLDDLTFPQFRFAALARTALLARSATILTQVILRQAAHLLERRTEDALLHAVYV